MISFDGKLISYDPQGNPLNYLGHALRWGKGRQLKSFDNYTYTYNANGIRISKTVDGIRHDYIVDGANILKETWQDNTLIPIYNNLDEVVGIHYNCEPYYFYKNVQGDVIGIADADGREVVTYTYDAWGVCTVLQDESGVGLANINPFRYRSYYYDTEIGMYYLQSRYYDPLVGRFINADDAGLVLVSKQVLVQNLYSYCMDSPVNNVDPSGFWVISAGVSIGGAAILGLSLFAYILVDGTFDFGIFIGVTLVYGYLQTGWSFDVAFYWGFKKIDDYLNSTTVSFGGGIGRAGGSLIYDYYKYPSPSTDKKFVGIQLSYKNISICQQSAPFDRGYYISLKEYFKKVFGSKRINPLKLVVSLKQIRIKIR